MATRGVPFSCPLRLRCSYRIATLIICGGNVVAALYLLHSFLGPLFLFPSPSSSVLTTTRTTPPYLAVKYTEEQLNYMKEAVALWKAAKPVELIKRVREIQQESVGYKPVEVAKRGVSSSLAQRLKELRDSNTKTDQEALEEWRKKKLEEAKRRAENAKAKQEEYLNSNET